MARAASIVENSGDGMDMANHFVHGNDTCSRVKLNNYKISIHNIADTSTGILRDSTDFQKDAKMLEDKATGSPVKEGTTRQRHDLPCDVTLSVAAASLAGSDTEQEVFSPARGLPEAEGVKRKVEEVIHTPAMVSGRHSKLDTMDSSQSAGDMALELSQQLCSLRKELHGTVTSKEALQTARSVFSMEDAKKMQRRKGSAYSVGVFNSGALGCTRTAVQALFKVKLGTEIDKRCKRAFFDFSGIPSRGDTSTAIITEEDYCVYTKTSSSCKKFSSAAFNPDGVKSEEGCQYVTQVLQALRTKALVIMLENVGNILFTGSDAIELVSSMFVAAGYIVKVAVVGTWRYGNVGNKRHFILVAISRLLGDLAEKYEIPEGVFSDETCYTARDIIDDVIAKERILEDLGDQNLQVKSSLPGAIHKVGQKAPGHGPAVCTHAVYGLDGQCPAATTLGAGRGVLPTWQQGASIDGSFMFSIDDTARARGFPDCYVPYMRAFDDSDSFIRECLGNAATQGFMLELDKSVHSLLQAAGVSHDIASSASPSPSSGKVLHMCVHPLLPSVAEEKEVIMQACSAAIQDSENAITLVFDTGAHAFFLPDSHDDCFVNGGRPSPAVIMAAKADSVMKASRTGRFRWMTSGRDDRGNEYDKFIVDMPDGAVHTVKSSDLTEGLAGYEPLYKMHFSLVINAEVEGGDSYAWRRINRGTPREFIQYIPILRDNERARHCLLVSPVKDDCDLEALIAKVDKMDFVESKSRLNAALSSLSQVHDEDVQETVDKALNHHQVHIDTWDTSRSETGLEELDNSLWMRASMGNIEDVIMQINKSHKKGLSPSAHKSARTTAKEEVIEYEVVCARTPYDKNVLGAKAVLRERRVRNLTEKEFLNRVCHTGCCDPSCLICNTVVGPIRQFKLKVNPYRETRPGFLFTLDMVQMDTRAVDGSLYVPQLRCVSCGFMPEITLILKDDWYGKFRALITRWRTCKVFRQHGYEVISVIKADNDSMWDNDNVE